MMRGWQFGTQLQLLGFKASEDEITRIFSSMDGDGSGELDLKEVWL